MRLISERMRKTVSYVLSRLKNAATLQVVVGFDYTKAYISICSTLSMMSNV